jgi:dTDP-4-dehydrorhamnose reductase
MNGHEKRPDDLQLFVDIGIKTIRYSLLWEKYSINKDDFFKLHEDRLNRLRQMGINPIAGLLHHGSGPFYTNLKDPAFPELLAEYALRVAEKFPWIQYYTPVNEPLTTARFSGLYGIWYPHEQNDNSFVRILLNEIKTHCE